jgi:hypothetical protein
MLDWTCPVLGRWEGCQTVDFSRGEGGCSHLVEREWELSLLVCMEVHDVERAVGRGCTSWMMKLRGVFYLVWVCGPLSHLGFLIGGASLLLLHRRFLDSGMWNVDGGLMVNAGFNEMDVRYLCSIPVPAIGLAFARRHIVLMARARRDQSRSPSRSSLFPLHHTS